jgi:hypothetical protein
VNLLHEVDVATLEVGTQLEGALAVNVEQIVVLFAGKLAAATRRLLHLDSLLLIYYYGRERLIMNKLSGRIPHLLIKAPL